MPLVYRVRGEHSSKRSPSYDASDCSYDVESDNSAFGQECLKSLSTVNRTSIVCEARAYHLLTQPCCHAEHAKQCLRIVFAVLFAHGLPRPRRLSRLHQSQPKLDQGTIVSGVGVSHELTPRIEATSSKGDDLWAPPARNSEEGSSRAIEADLVGTINNPSEGEGDSEG